MGSDEKEASLNRWAERCRRRGANAAAGPGTSGRAWYVVATKRHAEELARQRLGERGIESYLPLIVEWPPPAVGRPVQPLFPGYLLVHAALPEDFYRVTRTSGVKAFVVFGDVPPPLDDSCVEFLRAREGEDGTIRCAAQSGTNVCVVRGPLKGLAAVVERRIPARERVVVLLCLLQRETAVELPELWVRRA